MSSAVAFVAAMAATCAACGGPPRPDVVGAPLAPSAPSAAPAPARPPFELTPDRPIDGLAPDLPPVFTQETWSGAGEHPQHCHERAYPARAKADVVRQTNAILGARGLPQKLPDTLGYPVSVSDGTVASAARQASIVVAIADFSPDLIEPAEPLVKLVVCTEGVAPRSDRDRFFAALAADPAVPVAAFEEADLVWRRAYANGREEYGLRWSHVIFDDAARFFTSHGYAEEADDSALGRLLGAGARRWSRASPPARARLRGASAVWWSGSR